MRRQASVAHGARTATQGVALGGESIKEADRRPIRERSSIEAKGTDPLQFMRDHSNARRFATFRSSAVRFGRTASLR